MRNVRCKNCVHYTHGWCDCVADSPDPDMLRDCGHFWQLTNGQKLRAGGDADIALAFAGGENGTKLMCDEMDCSGSCYACVLEWLRKEVEWC